MIFDEVQVIVWRNSAGRWHYTAKISDRGLDVMSTNSNDYGFNSPAAALDDVSKCKLESGEPVWKTARD